MTKAVWLIVGGLLVGAIITIAALYFRVDKTTYTQVEQTETMHIDTAKPLEASTNNGRRLQDLSKDPNDRAFESVFPYLAAPHQ